MLLQAFHSIVLALRAAHKKKKNNEVTRFARS